MRRQGGLAASDPSQGGAEASLRHSGLRRAVLGLQTAQSRSYSFTLALKYISLVYLEP